MAKPFQSETRSHWKWAVTIHTDPGSGGFYTTCVSPKGIELRTEVCYDKGFAWQQGYALVEQVEQEEQTQRYQAIALPLTLALLYVTGWDESYPAGNPAKSTSRRAWKTHDWDILNALVEQQFLVSQRNPKQVKSVTLTPEGIQQARQILRQLNLEGIEAFLDAQLDLDPPTDPPTDQEPEKAQSNPPNHALKPSEN
jgi:hypothetical protein